MMTSVARAPGAAVAVSARAARTSSTTSSTRATTPPVRVAINKMTSSSATLRSSSSHHRRRAVVIAAAADGDDDVATEKPKAAAAGPPQSTPGRGKPPIDPKVLALGDGVAAVLATVIARGAAGEDVLSVGTLVAIPPFLIGWVGAGAFAGDYDADSPNLALWGDVPRAMSTGALTWFSGSAIAVLLRNLEGGIMVFPPVINQEVEFAGALGIICAIRALVAFTGKPKKE